jgi:hypothetical protein
MNPGKRASQHWARQSGVVLLASLALTLAGCSGGPPADVSPSQQVVPSATQIPVVEYGIGEGCPSAADVGSAWLSFSSSLEVMDFELLQGQLASSMPPGGCAYAQKAVGKSSTSDSTYRFVTVWYFNAGEAGKTTVDEVSSWAVSVGGVASPEKDFQGNFTGTFSDSRLDLPDEFSGWTGATVAWVDGVSSTIFMVDSPIPEYTSRQSAWVKFAMDSGVVGSIAAASAEGGATHDPQAALSQGLSATFVAKFDATDKDKYTVHIEVSGSLSPFISYVADSLPGEFEAQSSATVRGTVTNTTDGRNMTTPSVALWALYPIGSAACTGFDGISREGDSWQDASYCIKGLGGAAGTSLTPAQEVSLPPSTVPLSYGPYSESSSALADLNAPLSVYASFGQNPGLVRSTWTAQSGCLVSQGSSGVWVVAAEGWPDLLCQ